MAVEPEQRLSEALRARATGAGAPPPDRYPDHHTPDRHAVDEPEPTGMRVSTALWIALAVGLALGAILAMVSLLDPGVLPGTA